VPDFEAIRFDPLSQNIWYTSEGNRKLGLDPFIKMANRNGNFVSLLPALEMFQVHSDREYGSRNNFSYEVLVSRRMERLSGWQWRLRFIRTVRLPV